MVLEDIDVLGNSGAASEFGTNSVRATTLGTEDTGTEGTGARIHSADGVSATGSDGNSTCTTD